MSKVADIRRANVRALIGEKTARKIESALGLGVGGLDAPAGQPRPVQAPAQGSAADEGLVRFVADTIRTIGAACEAERVQALVRLLK